jgi:hypothetical protein
MHFLMMSSNLYLQMQVWEDSEGQSLLRIQVMVALQRLVCALGPQSPVCYEFLLRILDYSTNINQPDELNMLEDGLQVLKNISRCKCFSVVYICGLIPKPCLQLRFH